MTSFIFTYPQICHYFAINKNNKCKQKFYSVNREEFSICVCDDMNLKFTWSNTTLQTLKNATQKDVIFGFDFFFKNKQSIILGEQLSVLHKILKKISIEKVFKKYSLVFNRIILQKVKGFDVNSFYQNYNLTSRDYSSVRFYFYQFSLAFFSNGKSLRTCQEFPLQPRTIFQAFDNSWIFFANNRKKYKPVCPLGFANTKIFTLWLTQVSNTFYKTNIPTFQDLPPGIDNINSTINKLSLIGFGEMAVNSRIINRYLFNLTVTFDFFIEVTSIEKGLFKSFRKIRTIFIYMKYWRKLFQNGIEWTFDLNSDIRVNLSDSDMIQQYYNNKSFVLIVGFFDGAERAEIIFPNVFRDEDFCLYAKFPFEQMVLVYFDDLNYVDSAVAEIQSLSCTFVWLVNLKLFSQFYYNNINETTIEKFIKRFEKCNFNKR